MPLPGRKLFMKQRLIFLIPLLLLLVSGFVNAQVHFSGSTQSVAYVWENLDANQQFDFYQYVGARVTPASYQDLYFKTYFRIGRNGDPAEWNEKVHNAYLNWLSPCKKFEVRLGRQFLYAGVMNGTVDAFQLTARPVKNMNLRLVAGTEAPFERTLKMTGWDKGNVLGGYGSYRVSEMLNINASYYQKTRNDNLYWQLAGGAITGKLMNQLYYQANFDYNLKASDYQGMRYRISYYLSKWFFSAEYNSQKPRIYEDSFFQIFEQKAYNQIRTGVTYQLGDYELGLQYFNTMFEESESNNQVHFTVGSKYGYIGLLYQDGYGGKNTGVYGAIRYEVLRDLELKVTSSYYKYERQTIALSEDATAFSAGLGYKLTKSWLIRAEAQERLNSYFENDLRGLFRIQYAFNY
jgi:hypothetical protein